ncbi:MAG: SusD/RagB family nutrient-binding outer membrane lipoprotein [Bacteroidales bacterium]
MKRQNKIKRPVFYMLCLAGLTFGNACTDDFKNINTHPNYLDPAKVDLTALLQKPQEGIIPSGINMFQYWSNLHVDFFSGYCMGSHSFGGSNNYNYRLRGDFNHGPFENYYLNVLHYTREYTPVCKETGRLELAAISQISQVLGMLTVVDTYGPSPYRSSIEGSPTSYYDDDRQIYNDLFQQIDEAIEWLISFNENPTADNEKRLKDFAAADKINRGNVEKWIRMANTLRLRMAMRIVKAEPVLAQQIAEDAVNSKYGILKMEDEDCALVGGFCLRSIEDDWGDSRTNANLICILRGYFDPRLPKFVQPVGTIYDEAGEEIDIAQLDSRELIDGKLYVGIRQGVPIDAKDGHWYLNYSRTNLSRNENRVVMRPAEGFFLRAEGALRGWNMNGTAKDLYAEGIRSAFKSVGITDETVVYNYIIGELYADPDYWDNMEGGLRSAPYINYRDPKYNVTDPNELNNVSVRWHDSDSRELKLQRIMTQKWLALYPNSFEAWAEYRRTGYPKLMEVAGDNLSNGTIDSKIQIRRLPFTEKEYNTNTIEALNATKYLDGPDNGGTRIWWDVDNTGKAEPNF